MRQNILTLKDVLLFAKNYGIKDTHELSKVMGMHPETLRYKLPELTMELKKQRIELIEYLKTDVVKKFNIDIKPDRKH